MAHVGQDLRLAARRLIHDRAFTVLATVALGLGIGVNSTFFSLVNAAVLHASHTVSVTRPNRSAAASR